MSYIIMFDNLRSAKLNGETEQFIYFKDYPPILKGGYTIFKDCGVEE